MRRIAFLILGSVVAMASTTGAASPSPAGTVETALCLNVTAPAGADLTSPSQVQAGIASGEIGVQEVVPCAAAPSPTPAPSGSPRPPAPPSSGPSAAREVTGTPEELLALLVVAEEHPAGYDRDLFRHWTDADHDGCNTRYEVLITESLTPVTIGPKCALTGGSWLSAYDGVSTHDPKKLDVDHMIPLKEAWESGAFAWDQHRRQAFANDLGDERTLRAVTASSNRSKGDRDPAQWMPPLETFQCTYLDEWVVVKVRWSLAIDVSERSAIDASLQGCPAVTLVVTRA